MSRIPVKILNDNYVFANFVDLPDDRQMRTDIPSKNITNIFAILILKLKNSLVLGSSKSDLHNRWLRQVDYSITVLRSAAEKTK